MEKLFIVTLNGNPISIMKNTEEVVEFFKVNIDRNLEIFELSNLDTNELTIADLDAGSFPKNKTYNLGYIVFSGKNWLSVKQDYEDALEFSKQRNDLRIKALDVNTQ